MRSHMTSTRTRWSRAIVAAPLLGVLALAGCGRDESGGSDGGETAASEEIAEGEATGDITVWAMGAEGEKLPELVKDFEAENPDATVTVTAIPWDAAHDKIATAIAGGQTPDVSMLGTTWMGEFGGTDALDATPDESVNPDDFFEGAWNTVVVDGTAYGVPWYVETRLLYYRTDLAEKAGLEPPTDWAGLKDFAAGLQEAGAEYGVALQPGNTGAWQTFMPFAWQAGAELTDGDAYTLDTEPMQKALEYYRGFFDDGLSPTNVLRPGELESGFVDGRYGSFFSGPWHQSLIEETGGAEFADKWAVAKMPTEESGTSFVGGSNLAVFKESENRDSAWKLLQWLSTPEVQQQWYGLVGALPSVKSAWETGDLSTDEVLATFGEQLDDAKSPPTTTTWEQVAATIDKEIEKVVTGGVDPAEATKTMQTQAESIGTGS